MHPHRPPIIDRKVRFALVGCGRIADNHFDAIKKHAARCELVDVCDIDPAAVAAAATRTGAAPHADMSALLASSNADCVILATPSGLHPAQAAEAAPPAST